ncbi:MAG: hypothetical protein PUJ02_01045, partial [Anaerovibrio sp.]|nr:hypothetical protein [Anaerovibrio sp.]
VQRSEEARSVAAEVLDRLILDYSQRLAYVADKGDFANIQSDGEQRRAIYEWLYHEVNIAHDDTRFFLLDREGRILLATTGICRIICSPCPWTGASGIA